VPNVPEAHFDLVVGNPPFGTKLSGASEAALRSIAEDYHLWRGAQGPREASAGATAAELRRLRRLPMELLFLERFVQLCRAGGWIAIVLPEGAMANVRWLYVRQWLLDIVTLHAVVGLPRHTFRRHRTTAKTCLLLMHKQLPPADHTVALCEVDECMPDSFAKLLSAWGAGRALTRVLPEGLLPPPIIRS